MADLTKSQQKNKNGEDPRKSAASLAKTVLRESLKAANPVELVLPTITAKRVSSSKGKQNTYQAIEDLVEVAGNVSAGAKSGMPIPSTIDALRYPSVKSVSRAIESNLVPGQTMAVGAIEQLNSNRGKVGKAVNTISTNAKSYMRKLLGLR